MRKICWNKLKYRPEEMCSIWLRSNTASTTPRKLKNDSNSKVIFVYGQRPQPKRLPHPRPRSEGPKQQLRSDAVFHLGYFPSRSGPSARHTQNSHRIRIPRISVGYARVQSARHCGHYGSYWFLDCQECVRKTIGGTSVVDRLRWKRGGTVEVLVQSRRKEQLRSQR